jgi:hypothetical protein
VIDEVCDRFGGPTTCSTSIRAGRVETPRTCGVRQPPAARAHRSATSTSTRACALWRQLVSLRIGRTTDVNAVDRKSADRRDRVHASQMANFVAQSARRGLRSVKAQGHRPMFPAQEATQRTSTVPEVRGSAQGGPVWPSASRYDPCLPTPLGAKAVRSSNTTPVDSRPRVLRVGVEGRRPVEATATGHLEWLIELSLSIGLESALVR